MQREDVASSVTSLRNTIREINATSNERFRITFDEVNKRFGEVFQSLFGGGEAEMRLLDDEDLLESGIEIVARPPGKRLQNLMLLSGGEKALTAIALLVSLFHTKASPFCILDEVDAPLDDPNTVRFVEVLKSMSRDTQFLVITHNNSPAGGLDALRRHHAGARRVEVVGGRWTTGSPRAAGAGVADRSDSSTTPSPSRSSSPSQEDDAVLDEWRAPRRRARHPLLPRADRLRRRRQRRADARKLQQLAAADAR